MKVIIACGGSGGHIFPAIALAGGLKNRDRNVDIRFVGSNKTLDKRIFEKENFRYDLLSSNRAPYKLSLGTFIFFIRLSFDILRSLSILINFRPDVVVGFGGYISCPVILAAFLLKIPRVIHEQNVVPGRANAALFGIADRIAISFKETRQYMGRCAHKAVFTGNPIRALLFNNDKKASIKIIGLDQNKFTILVIGGSQGAHNLNKVFLKAMSKLETDIRSSLQVIHITGISDYAWVAQGYKELGMEHRTFSFIDRIEEAYSASDLVITRSGASAIFEIAYFGRPMILIPYPFALSHQSENARVFAARGAAIQIDEKDLSADAIKNKVLNLLKDAKLMNDMAISAKRLSVPESSYNLAQEILKVSKGEF